MTMEKIEAKTTNNQPPFLTDHLHKKYQKLPPESKLKVRIRPYGRRGEDDYSLESLTKTLKLMGKSQPAICSNAYRDIVIVDLKYAETDELTPYAQTIREDTGRELFHDSIPFNPYQ